MKTGNYSLCFCLSDIPKIASVPDHPLDMLEMRKMKANERNNKSVTGNETKDKENDRQQEH